MNEIDQRGQETRVVELLPPVHKSKGNGKGKEFSDPSMTGKGTGRLGGKSHGKV